MKTKSPFRIGRPVRGAYFAGRSEETDIVEHALRNPDARLLVYGGRHIGKSSVLAEARGRLRAQGLPAVSVDLGGATTVADMATRLLRTSTAQLRKVWKGIGPALADRLGTQVSLDSDPVTGKPTPMLDRAARAAPVEAQRETLGTVLDALEAMAADQGAVLGLGLDGIHDVSRFGGEDAEWHLRGVIQRHRNIGYVLVGGDETSTEGLTSKDRAFHGFTDLLHVTALPGKELAQWIDGRLKEEGIKTKRGVGREMVRLVGPRTGDVIRLARKTYDLARGTGLKVRPADLARSVDEIVKELSELLSEEWSHLTGRQQNLMRALAAGELQPFAERVRRLYDLRSSAAVARTLELLTQKGLVLKSADGYGVVSPYRVRWIELNALTDLSRAAE